MVAYWDTSALIPLLIEEEKSDLSRQLRNNTTQIITWILTSVEIHSCLCRLEREMELSLEDFQKCQGLWKKLEDGLDIITNIEAVKNISYRILRVHPLKSADSLQLAAAVLTKEFHDSLCFVTFDKKLKEAALKEGFEVWSE